MLHVVILLFSVPGGNCRFLRSIVSTFHYSGLDFPSLFYYFTLPVMFFLLEETIVIIVGKPKRPITITS